MTELKFILIISAEPGAALSLEPNLVALGYQAALVSSGKEALEKIQGNIPELIFIDSGIEGCLDIIRVFKNGEKTRAIPVLIITSLLERDERLSALEAGVDEVLTKPIDVAELAARVKSLAKLKAYNEHLFNTGKEIEAEVNRRIEPLKQAFEKIKTASLDTIFRLARAAEYKDEDTGAHIERMSHYSTAIARQMALDEQSIEYLLYAAPMHDIGKIGIPDSVLKKPGKLDPEEWVIMRQHTTMGAEILKDSKIEFIRLAEVIALTHHEKWDGSGYPRGLKGAETPLQGRIVAMADVFDALTSERPYKKPMPIEKAFSILVEGKGTHFDPDVVDAFFNIREEIEASLNWWKFMGSEADEEPLFAPE